MTTPIPDLGPHVGTVADDFLQSDDAIARGIARQVKQRKTVREGRPIMLGSKALCLALTPDGRSAFVGDARHQLRRVDLASGAIGTVFNGHGGPVTCVQTICDAHGEAKTVLTGSWDNTARWWDAQTGQLIRTFSGHDGYVRCLIAFPNENTLYTGSMDGTLRVWDMETGTCRRSVVPHPQQLGLSALAYDPATDSFFLAFSAPEIIQFKRETLTVERLLEGHQTNVHDLVLGDVGDETLWSVSSDKTAKRWDLFRHTCDATLEHPDFVQAVVPVHMPDGTMLIATGARDEAIRFWDPVTDQCVHRITSHFDAITALVVDTPRQRLWSASLDGTLRQWDLTSIIPQRASDQAATQPVIPARRSKLAMSAEEEAELAELLSDDE
ncbi:hypothetical protein CXG81DRAFT_11429 [Caulochytrium protostelioides]|uniref:WD40 repeat-like protein n=1 Tax=Caulochytrium protostelioides TaxID=1555241 RepID=A0A4P9WYZ2_9FUNG|nr:WD40 repeat-like protein [Caulochytrium protostelioides]RKP01870.1 hypothetical protein CXG81DRAFT_11429 [Caulochytrium protostelioides]|eukprot:RKP01870.1 hypothetical protein CXG81DRAFT_11429 [Caulochytrium protostelioides]